MESDKYYYSAKTGGFYRDFDRELYENTNSGWPEDAVVITNDEYKSLFEGQAVGKIITADSKGKPTLTNPIIEWNKIAETQRQSLLTEANTTIADWRTELQLDVISDYDKAILVKWMAYIKALKELDLSTIHDESGLSLVTWPSKP